jgi:translation initiation factor IF-3
VSTASEPWVCKLLDARKEEYLRQKKERARVKASKAQVLKEIAIRVRGCMWWWGVVVWIYG